MKLRELKELWNSDISVMLYDENIKDEDDYLYIGALDFNNANEMNEQNELNSFIMMNNDKYERLLDSEISGIYDEIYDNSKSRHTLEIALSIRW